jgi:hypothetical protein
MLCIQTMELADQDKFDFDPLDVTKIWPEHLFPLQPVGRMVLNKNIDNFFNENEQLAFCPALVVPGARAAAACLWVCAVLRCGAVASLGLGATAQQPRPIKAAAPRSLASSERLRWSAGAVQLLSPAPLPPPPPPGLQASRTATTSCCRRASSATQTRSATASAPTT